LYQPPVIGLLSRHVLVVLLSLVVINLTIYGSVGGYDFVSYDDPSYVSENPHVLNGITWAGIVWASTTREAANWHPLTWLSHMLDVQFFGPKPEMHHVTNVLFHTINSCLLFWLLWRMTEALGRSAFVAGLFAAHPLQVESVAWIAERKNVLSTLFALLALCAYVVYVRNPSRVRYACVMFLFAFGLMAKPMLVTLPFVMMLLDWWPLQRVSLPLFTAAQRPLLGKLLWEKTPLFVLSMASAIITFTVQHRAGAVQSLNAIPFRLRLFNAAISYVAYLGKTAWPAKLGLSYPFPTEIAVWKVVSSVLFLAIFTILVFRSATRRPYLATGWFWYVGTLVPVIGLVQVGDQAMADRYGYIPLIGVFLLTAWGLTELVSEWRFDRRVLPAAAVFVILLCALTARAQVQYWKNDLVLWQHALAIGDNPVAHVHVGNALLADGKAEEAMAHYSEALRTRPNFDLALDNLGIVLLNQGRFREALVPLKKAVLVNPSYAHAQNDLGVALERDGKIDEAIVHYSEAVRLDHDFSVAHVNLAKLLATHGRVDEAIPEYLEASRLKPDDAVPHYDLGIIFSNKNDIRRAISEFDTALRLNPGYADAQRALNILRNSGSRQ